MTRKKREIQKNLRVSEGRKRKSNDKVRVGYKKIFLNGKWHWWNEREHKFGEGRDGGKS